VQTSPSGLILLGMSNQSAPSSKTVTLMCGGKKCCPTLEMFPDGSAILHDTDDGRDQHIRLDANQTKLMAACLEAGFNTVK